MLLGIMTGSYKLRLGYWKVMEFIWDKTVGAVIK